MVVGFGKENVPTESSFSDNELGAMILELEDLENNLNTDRFGKIGLSIIYFHVDSESRKQSSPQKLILNLKVWMKAINILDSNIDKGFQVDDFPSMNVIPPSDGEMHYDSGVAPSAIENLEIRNQYIAMREAVRIKADNYFIQETLHDLQPMFSKRFNQFLEQTVIMNNPLLKEQFVSAIGSQINNPERRQSILRWFDPKKN